MKNKPITLKKFIETFSIKPFVKCETNIPSNFKDLSYSEKYKLYESQAYDTIHMLCIKNKCIFYGVKFKTIKRTGNRFYLKTTISSDYVYIMPNKIIIKGNSAYIQFLKLCNIDWFRDIPKNVINRVFINTTIYRKLLTNRVYSEETLYKNLGSIQSIKNVGWRLIKEYYESDYYGVSLQDLKYFTKNVEHSIIALSNAEDFYILKDLINCAIKLNEIVDLTWSNNRIREEHLRQIRTIKKDEFSNKSVTPVYDLVIGNENIRLLNTERDVFEEGNVMHHCLYTCYWNNIKRKEYIAFHMTVPEDCTFSVRLNGDNIILDQIYLKYDKAVQSETTKVAEQFLQYHKDELLQMFKEKLLIEKDNCSNTMFNFDIPF